MFTKESLSSVKGLSIAGRISSMPDGQFQNYVDTLARFVDDYPAISARLRSELTSRSYDKLAESLSGISGTLYKIHAESLAEDCTRHMNKIKRKEIEYDEIEAFLENFIQSVSSLSIDIQMAERKGTGRWAPAEKPRPAPAAAKRPSNRPLILAVDNAVMFLSTLQKLLKNAPYDLHCCETTEDAFGFLSDHRPDVILLDVEMPGMDGYSLAQKIKSGGQRAPIIFITAHSDREYVDKALEVGAAGLLVKPLRIKQLLEKLEEVLK